MTLEGEDTPDTEDELLLEDEAEEIGFADEQEETEGESEGEPIIGFSDDATEEETPLVKKLRDQLREAQRQARRVRETAPDDDPEPEVPDRPRSVADFDYDEDRFNQAIDAHLEAKEAHGAWKARQSEREASRQRAADEQTKRVEQQRNALGVSDYEERAATVKDTLSDAQLAVLINGADNPAQVIYALGRSQTRLAMLAGEDNLARFAVMLGKMEKEIKVTKRKAPDPEVKVRGATASTAVGSDKILERLEREADRTGDRSKIIAYKRQLKAQRAA